jgi:hypothetical protein
MASNARHASTSDKGAVIPVDSIAPKPTIDD